MPPHRTSHAEPETPAAGPVGASAIRAPHSPRQNHLLAALPPEDYERLLPALKPVSLPLGWTVHHAAEPEPHLYFITEGIVVKQNVTESGASAEFAVVGSEGVVGVALVLGTDRTPSLAMVASPGHAYRIDAASLKRALDHSTALRQLLLRYIQALMVQIGQTAVCNRHHAVEKRLCHWLLACLDRLPTNGLKMTQELIATMLGVRRESITEAEHRLTNAGLIQSGRGHLVVLDRPRLEAEACECYSVIHREYARLLPPSPGAGNAPTSIRALANA